MNKENLVNQLTHTKNNYIMGLAAFSLFNSRQAEPLLKSHLAAFGEYVVKFDQVAELLQNEKDRPIALNEFLKMLMRSLIKESFEQIKDYCENTEQYAAFKAEPWYEFARLIRNFLSHNCIFEFNKYDRERLPITWKKLTLTEDLHGKSLDIASFSHVQTWELFLEFEDFVKNRLR
jgi:hypothetical protein